MLDGQFVPVSETQLLSPISSDSGISGHALLVTDISTNGLLTRTLKHLVAMT